MVSSFMDSGPQYAGMIMGGRRVPRKTTRRGGRMIVPGMAPTYAGFPPGYRPGLLLSGMRKRRVVHRVHHGKGLGDVIGGIGRGIGSGLGGGINSLLSGLFGGRRKRRVHRVHRVHSVGMKRRVHRVHRGGSDPTLPAPAPTSALGKLNKLLKDTQLISQGIGAFAPAGGLVSSIGDMAGQLGYRRKRRVGMKRKVHHGKGPLSGVLSMFGLGTRLRRRR